MRTQWMPMIVDSKYESNTWRIMAIDMWQRSRRNPTTKNDTSSKYLNLIHILCYAMSNESEARIRLLASKDAAATWVLQISMLSMQQPFFGVSSRSSQEYKYKRQVKEHASMLSGEVAFTSDIEIRYKIQCSKSDLNNDDGNGIVALHRGTILTFTVNQFATCDISYVLRIKTSEFICSLLCTYSLCIINETISI